MNMHVSLDNSENYATLTLWDRTVAEHTAAKQALDIFNTCFYDPLYDELKRTAPLPDLSFEFEALDGKITRYRLDPAKPHAWDDHWSPVIRRKAAAIRDAWLLHRKTHEHLGLTAIGDESDRLCDLYCEIESTLIQIPAPDQSALLWKLERLFGPEACDEDDFAPAWCTKWMNAVMADARRLLGTQEENLSLSPG